MAQQQSGACMAHKTEYVYHLALCRQSLPISGVECHCLLRWEAFQSGESQTQTSEEEKDLGENTDFQETKGNRMKGQYNPSVDWQ